MGKHIQLDNVFLYCTEFNHDPQEIGKSRRSYNGTLHSQIRNSYNRFGLVIEGLSPSMHSNLLYVIDKNRSFNSPAENLTLVDDVGNEYIVAIPQGDYSYKRASGNKELYNWEINLEEVN